MAEALKKKNSLNREEAAAIYEDLRKNFAAFSGGKPNAAASKGPKTYMRPAPAKMQAKAANVYQTPVREANLQEDLLAAMIQKQLSKKEGKLGSRIALITLVLAAAIKFSITALEYGGVLNIESAFASFAAAPAGDVNRSDFSAEQVALLKSLDTRRAELEERRKVIEKREQESNNRDREFTVKLAELRELTQVLKNSREGDNKKKTAQLDQLSNVYGSMDPKEAALLIEQLDDTIALELLNRMPEKRIGQILSLMNKDKALMMTRMLSGKESAVK